MSNHHETFSPGSGTCGFSAMASRDLESHGFFLAPILQPGFHVLDAGCGPGTITSGIADAVFPGHVTAIDIQPERIESARRLSEGLQMVNIRFAVATVCRLPFADASFDVTFAHALLEHVHQPLEAMAELRRVTRPGGFLALCSPDWDAFEFDSAGPEVMEAIATYRQMQDHQHGCTRAGAKLTRWMTRSGFMILNRGEWADEEASPATMAEQLALRLQAEGHLRSASALRNWASQPGARFRPVWKYAVGLLADGPKGTGL